MSREAKQPKCVTCGVSPCLTPNSDYPACWGHPKQVDNPVNPKVNKCETCTNNKPDCPSRHTSPVLMCYNYQPKQPVQPDKLDTVMTEEELREIDYAGGYCLVGKHQDAHTKQVIAERLQILLDKINTPNQFERDIEAFIAELIKPSAPAQTRGGTENRK